MVAMCFFGPTNKCLLHMLVQLAQQHAPIDSMGDPKILQT
jgi:hypothetical protein